MDKRDTIMADALQPSNWDELADGNLDGFFALFGDEGPFPSETKEEASAASEQPIVKDRPSSPLPTVKGKTEPVSGRKRKGGFMDQMDKTSPSGHVMLTLKDPGVAKMSDTEELEYSNKRDALYPVPETSLTSYLDWDNVMGLKKRLKNLGIKLEDFDDREKDYFIGQMVTGLRADKSSQMIREGLEDDWQEELQHLRRDPFGPQIGPPPGGDPA